MELLEVREADTLSTLEERIHRAIELVARLRREKDALTAERDAALEQVAALSQELDTLRAERQQVRSRVEKLLTQIDSLSAA